VVSERVGVGVGPVFDGVGVGDTLEDGLGVGVAVV
jgi:hypothetical protein